MVKVQLCINLRSGKVAVPQQFLYGTDIARCLQKMGCIAVAHHVRRDMAGTAHAHCPRLQAFLDLTLPQPAAVLIGEQGLLALFGNTHCQIIAQCRNAFSHQRHLPLLAAFTLHADPAFIQDDTVQIQTLDRKSVV